jgi:2-hydroxychromene-2-carboxylate isomerase/ketosteroid isomerase-like protein
VATPGGRAWTIGSSGPTHVGMKIEFAFDYASPWSFLASSAAAERFAGIAVAYLPVYLRGFDAFREGVPYSPAKLAYLLEDATRSAALLGVTMKAPSTFPINGVYALRGAIAAQREGVFEAFHRATFAAAWQEDRGIGDREVVKAIAREVGAPAVAEAVDDPAIKEALRSGTEAVVKRGAFGVPTFLVGGRIFWGQDRMLDAARFARGEKDSGTPRTREEAWAFARRWAGAWSRLDVEAVLEHFADETVFVSPLAKQLTGNARVVGKEALRAYWLAAVEPTRAMRFDVVDVAWSPADRMLVVVYDRTKDGATAHCAEHLRFGESGRIVEGQAFYGA